MTHTIYVGASSNWHLIAWCTCSPSDPLPFASREVISLAEISELAHEHIEAAEREPGYRVESALTSEDQLINLEAISARESLEADRAYRSDVSTGWDGAPL